MAIATVVAASSSFQHPKPNRGMEPDWRGTEVTVGGQVGEDIARRVGDNRLRRRVDWRGDQTKKRNWGVSLGS